MRDTARLRLVRPCEARRVPEELSPFVAAMVRLCLRRLGRVAEPTANDRTGTDR